MHHLNITQKAAELSCWENSSQGERVEDFWWRKQRGMKEIN